MNKYLSYVIFALSAALGLFFIYKGVNKHFLSECKVYGPDSTLPLEYRNVISALCQSGFTKIIGFLEVFSGILLLVPRTRLAGGILLMPVILTIFLLHAFLDNRPHELVETGIPLAVTLLVILYHYPKWKSILGKN
ncbi:hypothetical protein GCM10009118_28620 [Wandonia haliotis]|uniref:DoxX family protein n=1 Tax=Wandonia haliotis TaxID=574963 RepID=A0ABP3Y9X5_9FLAO